MADLVKEVITVGSIDKTRKDDDGDLSYVNFTAVDGRKFNYGYNPKYDDKNIAAGFKEGRHIEVKYKMVTNNNGSESRYIKSARVVPDDVPDTQKPKAGGVDGPKGKKDDYDPEVGKRQTAANCAMQWCKDHCKDADEVGVFFPAVADIVLQWINEKADATFQQTGATGDPEAGRDPLAGDDDDEEFGF